MGWHFRLLSQRILIIALAALLVPSQARAEDSVYTIGIQAVHSHELCEHRWQATADYLTDSIEGCRFEISTLMDDDIVSAVENGEVDFVITNAPLHVDIGVRYGLRRLATMVNYIAGEEISDVGGVIFYKSGRDDITSVEDLYGKTARATCGYSLGGWLSVQRELYELGFDPVSDFGELDLSHNKYEIVEAVRAGECDLGIVRSGILERCVLNEWCSSDDFEILLLNSPDDPEYPFVSSTRLYPEWTFSSAMDTPEPVAAQVAVTLLEQPVDSDASNAANIAGWTVPHNYEVVRDCLETLKYGPFEEFGKPTLKAFYSEYGPWLIICGVLLCLSGISAMLLLIWNRRLRSIKRNIKAELKRSREMESALRSSESRLSGIMSSLYKTVILVTDHDTLIQSIWADPGLEEKYGLIAADSLGTKLADIHRPEHGERIERITEEVYDTGQPQSIEIPWETPGGLAWIHASFTPFRNEQDETTGVIIFARDVSDQVLANAALKDSEERYRILADNAVDVVWSVDMEGRITYVSPSCYELTGYMPDEYIGKSAFEFLDATDKKDAINKFLQDIKDVNQSLRTPIQARCRRKDGSFVCTETVARVIFNDEGNPCGMQGITRNITAQKEYQAELEEARNAAEVASQAKSAFLANISHEIRTPMNGIIGLVQSVMSSDLNDMQREHLTDVLKSAESLTVIINDILDLSRIEEGKLPIEKIPFNLKELVGDVERLFEIAVRDKGLELSSEYDIDLPEDFIGDPLRIRQVLTNFVGNAVKFTSDGHVKIRLKCNSYTGSHAEFTASVEDTGIGIEADRLKYVYEKFTQADETTTRKYGGTGLGLTIARELVQLMDGEIGVDSEPGRGSTFHFTLSLPVAKSLESSDPSKTDRVNYRGDFPQYNVKVLVAEDNPVNRRVAELLLGRMGCDVHFASDGDEAVRMFRKHRYDILFMDCQMPIKDGYEATAEIRKIDPEGADVPIIAITAYAMRGARERCVEAGMDGYISKPIHVEELLETMARWLTEESVEYAGK